MEMEEVCTVNKLQTAFKIFDIVNIYIMNI